MTDYNYNIFMVSEFGTAILRITFFAIYASAGYAQHSL